MIRVIFALAMVLVLSGCGATDRLRPGGFDRPLRSERLAFDGVYFRAKARHTSEDRRDFSVTVRNAQRSLSGAYDAGYFEAVKYCVGLFGASDLVLDAERPTPEETTQPLGGSGDWTMIGRCTAR